MTLAILGLTAGFILVLAILLVILLKCPINPLWKLLCILLASGFYLLQYQSLLQYAGWPTDDALPQKFGLFSAHVSEERYPIPIKPVDI